MTVPAYDIFISHAYEDKNDFTNGLALSLKKSGLKIWYSGFDLQPGDSIAESVNKALADAAYAIVVISPVYLRKDWAMTELKALFAVKQGRSRILPILHNITMNEIQQQLPILADRYAISSDKGIELITEKVLRVIKGKKKSPVKKKIRLAKPEKKKKKGGLNISGSGFITLGPANIKTGTLIGRDNVSKSKKK